jgi:hypothetical protein
MVGEGRSLRIWSAAGAGSWLALHALQHSPPSAPHALLSGRGSGRGRLPCHWLAGTAACLLADDWMKFEGAPPVLVNHQSPSYPPPHPPRSQPCALWPVAGTLPAWADQNPNMTVFIRPGNLGLCDKVRGACFLQSRVARLSGWQPQHALPGQWVGLAGFRGSSLPLVGRH